MTCWKVNLLGEFSLTAPDGLRISLPGRKHQALLAYLSLSSRKTVSRERLLGLLWGSRSDDQARASLRGVLSELKRSLQNYDDSPIRADRSNIYLNEELVEIDTEQLYGATKSVSLESLSAAVDLYEGDLLESVSLNEQAFEEWKQIEQQNTKVVFRKLLARYLAALEAENREEEIEQVANRLLELDSADEDAHRTLMKLYHRQGKSSLVQRQFELCRDRLRSQYNTDVSAETLSLLTDFDSSSALAKQKDHSGKDRKSAVMAPPVATQEIALAVMPFSVVNSNKIGVEFGELVSEEIIGAVARFKWFRVLPQSETFRHDLNSLGSGEICSITGAKYLLSGRVRKIRDIHQLKVELVDGVNNSMIWSEGFEFGNDSLSYPEDIVATVVGQLEAKIRASEISQTYRLSRQNLSAYQYSLLALSNFYDLSSDTYEESEKLFADAVNLNPNNSWFYSIWALWKTFCAGQVWGGDTKREIERAAELAHQAIKRDPEDALALLILGHIESFLGCNLEQGKKLIDNSLKLNPYSSFAWMLSSATCSYSGEPLEALRRLEKSKSLCPVESHWEFLFDTATCLAHLFNHDPEQAVQWGYKTVRENPGFSNGYKHLLVALGHLGRTDECENYLGMLMKIEPTFEVEAFLNSYPFALTEDREFYRQGLDWIAKQADAKLTLSS
jgi:DNA-binding SARP family transcriptional activator